MRVAIHQLNYLPYGGFFYKLKNADLWVILDNLNYVTQKFQNRNKIRTSDGWMYLTIPIEKKYRKLSYNKVKLPSNQEWRKNHVNSLIHSYSHAPFYKNHIEKIKEIILDEKNIYLFELSEKIIYYMLECFDIKIKIIKASKLPFRQDLRSTNLLVEIIKNVSGNQYISGVSGVDYMDEALFEKEKIKLKYIKYKEQEYKQVYEGYHPNMSAIDLLFNKNKL